MFTFVLETGRHPVPPCQEHPGCPHKYRPNFATAGIGFLSYPVGQVPVHIMVLLFVRVDHRRLRSLGRPLSAASFRSSSHSACRRSISSSSIRTVAGLAAVKNRASFSESPGASYWSTSTSITGNLFPRSEEHT